MTEKKKTISDNSLVKQAYIASGIALLSLGAGTVVNSNNVKADTLNTQNTNSTTVANTTKIDTSQSSVNNSESQNNNSQTNSNTLQLSKRNVQVNSTETANTQNIVNAKNATVATNTTSKVNQATVSKNTNTDYSYSGTIEKDVSSTNTDAAKNATDVQGAVKVDSNNVSYNVSLNNVPSSVSNFVNKVGNDAIRVANEYGLYASVMLAQASLESAWGQSALATNAHNLFGVKYRGYGDYVTMPTLESYGGRWYTINAKFQKYNSYYDSLVGYAQLIKNGYPGSTKSGAASYQIAANNLLHGKWGAYATDPSYVNKIINMINTYGFYKFDNPQSNTHQKFENGHWYLYKDGKRQTGLRYITSQGKTVFYNNQGQMQYGQKFINGHWYYFDEVTGAMLTGFKYIPSQKKNVYYNSQGQMLYGQKFINGHWYLFDNFNGAMKTGFVHIPTQNKTVYYSKNEASLGQMLYGFQNINGKTYYFDTFDGAMKTGWSYISENKSLYYFKNNGQAAQGKLTLNNTSYDFDSQGKLLSHAEQFSPNGTDWYFFDDDGYIATGWKYISYQNKKVYYDKKTGIMKHGQVNIDGHWYFFDKVTGAMKTGWVYIPEQNKTVYYNKDGQMVYGTQIINGKTYYFDTFDGTLK